MKRSSKSASSILLCSTAVLAAPDPCERVKKRHPEDRQQWRTGNRLQSAIVPTIADQARGSVVGRQQCDTFKITGT